MTNEEDIRRILNRQIEKTSQSDFAKEHGFSKGFISDVLKGRRNITDRLAGALGYIRKTIFIKKGK